MPWWIFEHCLINPNITSTLWQSFLTNANGQFLWNLIIKHKSWIYGKLNHISLHDTKILPSWRLGVDKCHSAEIWPTENKRHGGIPLTQTHTYTLLKEAFMFPMSKRTISFLLSIHTVTCVECNSCSDYKANIASEKQRVQKRQVRNYPNVNITWLPRQAFKTIFSPKQKRKGE